MTCEADSNVSSWFDLPLVSSVKSKDCRARATFGKSSTVKHELVKYASMPTGGYSREWRRGDTPSWYDCGWPQEGKPRKKSPAGYRDWVHSQGSEAVGASTEKGQGVMEQGGRGIGQRRANGKYHRRAFQESDCAREEIGYEEGE